MQSDQRSAAIIVDNVSKRYVLGTPSPLSLSGVRRLWRRLRARSPTPDSTFWALRNVSFLVYPGEVLGIIGPNGAGKTTILKLLAGVTRPTQGRTEVNGKLSALIELGAGFHPELTGRENIYLNGAILGMKRREVDKVLDDIIEFSELRPFIDTPVKRYSSGMYARLGFSVAVYVNPDTLLVDEVLSVGDMAFQQKSLQRMLEFKAQAKAMVFVSHNLIAVQQLCNRVLWLDHGHVVMQGKPDEVIEQYRRSTAEHLLEDARSKHKVSEGNDTAVVRIARVQLLGSRQQSHNVYRVRDTLRVKISLCIRQPLPNFACGVALYRHDGLKLGEASNLFDGVLFGNVQTDGEVTVGLSELPLAPGTYYINVAISDGYLITYDHVPYAAQFSVEGTEQENMMPGPLYLTGVWHYTPCSMIQT